MDRSEAKRRLLCSWAGVLVALAGATAAVAGPAVNQFEVKDLESEPGDMQFQSQNAISGGQPRRRARETAPGEFVYDDNTIARERYALEMQMGITSWFRTRLGVEFEKERLDDPANPAQANSFADLHFTGVALEGVLVLVPVKREGVGLGLLVEYDHAVRGGQNQLYAGPIVQAVAGPWSALANLLLVQNFGSPDRSGSVPDDRKRDFAYATQLQYQASPSWAIALEAYGTLSRIGNSGTRPAATLAFGDFDQHRLGPVIYYRFDPGGGGARPATGRNAKGLGKDDDDRPGAERDGDKDRSVSLGVGLLFGLNAATPDRTLKLSLEYNF